MKLVSYPNKAEWPDLLRRSVAEPQQLEKQVRKILEKVQKKGDAALRKLTRELDGVKVKEWKLTTEEMEKGAAMVPDELAQAIRTAAANIRRFHETQLQEELPVETAPGILCWRRSVAIDKVGLYIPGGTAPLFSTVLMLGIPAQIAGCDRVILCTPPAKDGSIHPAVLYAAQLTGISEVYRVGGAQAIAAMAYGTETIPKVDKIFGPGNQYVTCAKQLVQLKGTAIDMPAGPSEVCVLADETANPAWVAADLLSQAEHGTDSQVLLVTTDPELPGKMQLELEKQLADLPRRKLAEKALAGSKAILVKDMEEAMTLVNEYAAEHLILACDHPEQAAARIRNAGSVFLGHYSPESAGDYASGTNHTLPTNGFAKAYSGVSADSFVKKITYQRLSAEGLAAIGQTVITLARAEGLDAHAEAVRIRML